MKCLFFFSLSQVESDTAQSMKRLVELDSIKSKMLQSQNALQVNPLSPSPSPPTHSFPFLLPSPSSPTSLSSSLPFLPSFPSLPISSNPTQEADNWTTLSADVEEVFASQDILKVENYVQQFQFTIITIL